jgi:hypothetical protein
MQFLLVKKWKNEQMQQKISTLNTFSWIAKKEEQGIELGSKKVEISRTSLFLHEKLDTMILFLHITDPVCLPVPIKPRLNRLLL